MFGEFIVSGIKVDLLARAGGRHRIQKVAQGSQNANRRHFFDYIKQLQPSLRSDRESIKTELNF